ncbi:hypothetical protein [Haliangium sp.]|uniref:hypothetical protein n=1 Tax=Haliangium sp. TaxID=2663208 RepID=UPI003D0E2383
MSTWLLVAGCSDDAPAPDAGVPDAFMRPPDAAVCMPGCEGDMLRLCDPDEVLTPCALGCNAEGPACFELVPQNGANQGHLNDVDADLVIPAGVLGHIDTDTGEILVNSAIVRRDGLGVVNGIGYYGLPDDIAVLSVNSLSVAGGARLRLTGTRALIILSADAVFIAGVIDVAAGCDGDGRAHCAGPGGGNGSTNNGTQAQGCAPGGNGGGGLVLTDETGGGGGGFGSDGAPGGDGGDRGGGIAGLVNGSGCVGPELVPLSGGSGGGAGGLDSDGGDGGGGGGAVQITSFTSITMAGAPGECGVDAGGAGGRGGESDDGGGGGGSGGAILLEAPIINLDAAILAANGGGGGGGGGNAEGNRAEDGVFGARQAQGGGNGGAGASSAGPAVAGTSGGDNTGGGGGGTGYIRLVVPETALTIDNAVVSPAFLRDDLILQ